MHTLPSKFTYDAASRMFLPQNLTVKLVNNIFSAGEQLLRAGRRNREPSLWEKDGGNDEVGVWMSSWQKTVRGSLASSVRDGKKINVLEMFGKGGRESLNTLHELALIQDSGGATSTEGMRVSKFEVMWHGLRQVALAQQSRGVVGGTLVALDNLSHAAGQSPSNEGDIASA